jgi:hypothetical protein
MNRHNAELQLEVSNFSRANTDLKRQVKEMAEDAERASQWQNEVANEIPEEGWDYNVDGAQEDIILDYVRYLNQKVAEQGQEIAEQDQAIVSLNESLDNYQNAAVERGMADE